MGSVEVKSLTLRLALLALALAVFACARPSAPARASVPSSKEPPAVRPAASVPATTNQRVDICDEWPPGARPEQIGKSVAENFVVRPLGEAPMHYAQACAWYGALSVAERTGDEDLTGRLVARFDPIFTAGASLVPARDHVDDRVFGIAPLQIARQSSDHRYLTLGLGLADAQWSKPSPDGITHEARYWIDDMYMITALQVQAFRATGDRRYLDRAAITMAAYLERLQQPNGLFFHTAASPVHWARGNGWVAAGMTELMLELSVDHPRYEAIREGYTRMMSTLLDHQRSDGLWRQIIDDEAAWPETSGSAMFTFGMISGVRNGWLTEQPYREAACRAWLGVIQYLDEDGNLREVCVGTGDADSQGFPASDPVAQRQYYLDRPRHAGDFHGQAPLLWAAAAQLR